MFFQVILKIIFFIPLASTILDDDILYDIKWQPELISPTELDNNYTFISQRKEKYSCILPTLESTVTTTAETILLSEVIPLIENLYSKQACTYRLDPYWTYELCHGMHIRQYHETKVAGKRIADQEYFLGYYHPDKQDVLKNTDNQELLKIHYKILNNQEIPMLSARYTDGTICDINSNKPRETVVFYVCNEKHSNNILSFQEMSSCYYEMIVGTLELCTLSTFSPPESNRHTINCYPQANALQKPRNLKKIEHKQQLSLNQGEGPQFTITSADGTTFIISYEYVNIDDIGDITNKITSPTPPESDLQLTNDKTALDFLTGQVCLTGGSDWWKYEVCYGKHIVQFHEEGQERTSILLGEWNHEKHIEWINNDRKRRLAGNIKDRRYVSLHYSDGDICELTQNSRIVEVKLKCPKQGDTSEPIAMYLVEPETCSYILGIESPIFCNLLDYTDEHGIPDQEKLLKSFEEQ